MKGITMSGHTAPTMNSTSGLEFIFMFPNRNVEDNQRPDAFQASMAAQKKSLIFPVWLIRFVSV